MYKLGFYGENKYLEPRINFRTVYSHIVAVRKTPRYQCMDAIEGKSRNSYLYCKNVNIFLNLLKI